MGNAESSQSVRFANQTEIPLVCVISQVGPLYWRVLQPGERWTKQTGRVWFTLEAYPYTGGSEPTTTNAVLSILVLTAGALFAVATGSG